MIKQTPITIKKRRADGMGPGFFTEEVSNLLFRDGKVVEIPEIPAFHGFACIGEALF
ncbi:MAG: hypothetical protein HN445_11055 [Bacteroidetes Order II. Incertae sedis bacterium]|nr:hypothetical protein [Bacteroidetes Order II. bacterium]